MSDQDPASPKVPFDITEFTKEILQRNEGAAAAAWIFTQIAMAPVRLIPAFADSSIKDAITITVMVLAIITIKFTFRVKKKKTGEPETKSQKAILLILNSALCWFTAMGYQMTIAIASFGMAGKLTGEIRPAIQQESKMQVRYEASLFGFIDTDPWLLTRRIENVVAERNTAISQLKAENNVVRKQADSLSHTIESLRQEESLPRQIDSLNKMVIELKAQVTDKQNQIDQLIASSASDATLKQQLVDCNKKLDAAQSSLTECEHINASANTSKGNLQSQLDECLKSNSGLKSQLDNCNTEKAKLNETINSLNDQLKNSQKTLVQTIQEACNPNRKAIYHRPGTSLSQDEQLVQQDFWKSFCASFNGWNTTIK